MKRIMIFCGTKDHPIDANDAFDAFLTASAAAARQATAPALWGRWNCAGAGNPHDADTDLTAPRG